MATSGNCPICELELVDMGPPRENRDSYTYACTRCGRFELTREAQVNLRRPFGDEPHLRFLLSHEIRKMQAANDCPLLTTDLCDRILEGHRLPTASAQADNAIRWLGDHVEGPGASRLLTEKDFGGIIGTIGQEGFRFVIDGLTKAGLIEGAMGLSGGYPIHALLTFKGWERYEELRRGAASGKNAFMAMKFGDLRLDEIVDTVFRPAVAATGFNLARLSDTPKAGLIDDRMRVEIGACRFLIADLSHGNAGAYWEAGYAEGLGKPVIYTCERMVFEDPERRPHFDTNHHQTVFWSPDNPQQASEDLKATIRVSIPEASRE